ncbi:BTAD domain-containing putative transcriptional regulator [Saccharothrix yanglingensis]|uniref:Transcriptional regulator n=1 Tax=Saccharothrix yanglingensis TaxID=659496 RepID=A0ABU0XCU1_9PSEU|nr:BTAD domain-containing putative transcriptional regulator [Saccharothrix yanglingensis]MDQ2589049.1 transcriptional regulator [Saccharothrix yanglingensis]
MTATTDSALRVELLGPVRAWARPHEEVELGSLRPRAVFAVLALRVGSVVPREELIDGVWGEEAPPTAEGSLYTYVSQLRKALEPDRRRGVAARLLVSVGSGYSLRVDPGDVDAVAFERLGERARRQLSEQDAEGALRSLDAALAMWRGDALSGLTGPFARAQRQRLGELRVAARELRAEAALANGLHANVVAELSSLVREHPLREQPRALLMLALYRCGRGAEALDVYRQTRQVLVDELGVRPSPRLRALHQQVLSDDPALLPPTAAAVVVTPAAASARSSVTLPRPQLPGAPVLVGREGEERVVREALHDVRAGHGRALWVEGEMGIGKSALVAATLAHAAEAGAQVAHAVADELGRGFPLRLALDCLGVHTRSPDPRRVAISRALRDDQPGRSVLGGGDPVLTAIDRLVDLVEQLCQEAPLALALDDLQWADEASMELWHRLCVRVDRLPLLLVGAARPLPRRPEVEQLRRDVRVRGGELLTPQPLDQDDVAGMVGDLVGAVPGPGLRRITARAGGNPLYVREVADALVREGVVHVGEGTADVGPDALDRVPVSLVSAVADRLGFLSEATREVLRSAALLGGEFAVNDLALVLSRPVSELVKPFEEAVEAGVLRDAGLRLAFRHPLIRQALYEGMPGGLRVALHHQAAQTLAEAGAPVENVARQLLAAEGDVAAWVVDWLAGAAPALTYRAPLVAIELLRRCTGSTPVRDARWATLTAHLSSVLFRMGRDVEAEESARRALPRLTDPDRVAEVRWVLAYVPYRASRAEAALVALHEALEDPVLPDVWRARLVSLLALVQRAGVGDLEASAASAREAVALGERVDDRFSVGQALEVLWQVDAVRRDYTAAVGHLDRALAVVGTDISLADLRLVLLDNRIFTLQCLDRTADAEADLRLAFEIAGHGTPVAGLRVAAAVHHFWLGGWEEVVAQIDAVLEDSSGFTGFGLREGGPVLLLHGVAALVAAHRDDSARLGAHLDAGENLPLVTAADRENCDFLVAARAASADRDGDPARAASVLGGILDTRYAQMMLRHQWLPDLVRYALACGDAATAHEAAAACEAEAARETTRARAAAAARRCRGVLDGDPDGLTGVIAHYRAVGRAFELAQTLEDQAVLLARRGLVTEADGALTEALALYRGFGAAWDERRARARVLDRSV